MNIELSKYSSYNKEILELKIFIKKTYFVAIFIFIIVTIKQVLLQFKNEKLKKNSQRYNDF